MKKLLLLTFLIAFAINIKAQSTYYWKGAAGAALTPTDFQVSTNWNTLADGSGGARTTPADDDILVFDGAANTATVYVGNIPTQAIGTLKITANANVSFMTIVAPTVINNAISSVTGFAGCAYTIGGSGFAANVKKGDFIFTTQALNVQVLAVKDDNTITTSNENAIAANASYSKYTTLYPKNLLIDAGSTLNMAGNVSGTSFNSFAIITEGGTVAGSIVFPSRASYCKLYCTTSNVGDAVKGLHIVSGGAVTYNTSTNGQKNFLLGSTLGLYDGSGIFIYNDGGGSNNKIPGYTGNAGIVFESGSTFTNTAGNHFFVMGNSWNANNTDLVFTPGVYFKSGSNYVANGSPVYSPYWPVGLAAGLTLGNVEFKAAIPSATTTTTNASFNATVDNLTISGTVPVTSVSGYVYVKGSITNSTTNSNTVTFANAYLVGSTNQTINASTGGFTFTNLVIADKAEATLSGAAPISATNLYIVGKLNFGSKTIAATGTTPNLYTFAGPYAKATTAAAFTKGSNVIGGVNGNTSLATPPYTYDYPIGASLTNAVIPAGTIFRSYTSAGNGVMSNLAQSTIDISTPVTSTLSVQGSSYSTTLGSLATSATGFTNYYTDVNASVLPLDLLSFEGELTDAGVLLKWTTTNELNVKSFVLEKQASNGLFIGIASISSKNSGSLTNYSFVDATLSAGTNYYRIKVLDADGSVKLSTIVSVTALEASVVSIYPNPAIDVSVVKHPTATQAATVRVFTIDGKVAGVYSVEGESSKTEINLSTLSSGVYVLEFNDGAFVKKLKFIKK